MKRRNNTKESREIGGKKKHEKTTKSKALTKAHSYTHTHTHTHIHRDNLCWKTKSPTLTPANLYSWLYEAFHFGCWNKYMYRKEKAITYIMIPGHFVWFRVRSYGAFKINAIAFFNIIRVKWRSHFQRYHWHIW